MEFLIWLRRSADFSEENKLEKKTKGEFIIDQ